MNISYSKLCKIREIVNYYDPEEWGAPPDEYYDFVDRIVAKIESAEVGNIKKVIVETFGCLADRVESKKQFIQKLENIANEISDCLKLNH